MTEQRLAVVLGGERVGTLRRADDGTLRFGYEPAYRERVDAIPLSLSLPLSTEGDFAEGPARSFFAGLLPEGTPRQLLARQFGLAENDDFGLLAEIGGDCAGAVSVLPEDRQSSANGGYRPVDRKRLRDAMGRLSKHPLLAGETGVRLSLAGVQAKLPVGHRNGSFAIPVGGPSTHILKPPIADADGRFAGSVHNEAFTMRLARRAGLPVASVTAIDLEPQTLLVERYDRSLDEHGRLVRIHQEDFCQALGITPERKYEADGGPGLADCFGLLRDRVTPSVSAVNALLDWVVFSYLTGNGDAHGKNVALLLRPDGPALAPFHDLLCTAAWDDTTPKLAMRIGDQTRPEWVRDRHWQQFAEDCGLTWRLVRDRLRHTATRLPGLATDVRRELETEAGTDPILDRIEEVIADRCARVLDHV